MSLTPTSPAMLKTPAWPNVRFGPGGRQRHTQKQRRENEGSCHLQRVVCRDGEFLGGPRLDLSPLPPGQQAAGAGQEGQGGQKPDRERRAEERDNDGGPRVHHGGRSDDASGRFGALYRLLFLFLGEHDGDDGGGVEAAEQRWNKSTTLDGSIALDEVGQIEQAGDRDQRRARPDRG
jgi:hypothetical protein